MHRFLALPHRSPIHASLFLTLLLFIAMVYACPMAMDAYKDMNVGLHPAGWYLISAIRILVQPFVAFPLLLAFMLKEWLIRDDAIRQRMNRYTAIGLFAILLLYIVTVQLPAIYWNLKFPGEW